MGYFEGLVAGSFKTSLDGKRLFYPWGPWSKGYELPSKAYEQRLLADLTRRNKITLLTIILSQFALSLISSLISFRGLWGRVYLQVLVGGCIVAAASTWYWRWLRHHVKNLPVTTERLSMQETMNESARAHSLVQLIAMEISVLMLLLSTIWLITNNMALSKTLLGAGAISAVFQLWCFCVIGLLIVKNLQAR